MMGFFRKILKGSVIGAIGRAVERRVDQDDLKLMIGRLHSDLVRTRTEYRTLADLEFRVFSQFGDDGIIQVLSSSELGIITNRIQGSCFRTITGLGL
jgi:hypothetical protein